MSIILPIGSGIAQLEGVSGAARAPQQSFAQVVQQLFADANNQQLQADQAVKQLALGHTDNIHHVMLALGRADLGFRTILEIRNRLTEAYQDVMRMQV